MSSQDNCARALTGTASGAARPSSRINTDCSSFQLVTVYPAATTTTIASGSTSTTILPETTGTTVAPFSLPAYAKTACTPSGSASARFASACSCAGVTKTTTTARVPVATVIVPTGGDVPSCDNPLRYDTYDGSSNVCMRSSSDTCEYNCYQRISGGNVCVQADPPCGRNCNSDTECDSGDVCITNTFCRRSNCVPASSCAGQRHRALQKRFGDHNNPPKSS